MAAPLELQGVTRAFAEGSNRLKVLRGVDLTLARGELVALVAPSGAGKSTLLHIAGLLERADAGAVIIDGKASAGLSDLQRTALRRERIGFVYQFHHLLGDFSARENIAIPQRLAGVSRRDAVRRADALLEQLGLGPRAKHRPAQLSGGERQRVAIARAVANSPSVLLADEPTGNLDQGTAEVVRDALLALSRESGLAALVATHNTDLAARLDRTVTLTDGRIVD